MHSRIAMRSLASILPFLLAVVAALPATADAAATASAPTPDQLRPGPLARIHDTQGAAPAPLNQEIALSDDWACVTGVVDGDTVAIEGHPSTIRLAGIDAPERTTSLGPVAQQMLAEWVAAAECWVWIEPASPSWDAGTQRYRGWLWIEDPVVGWYLVQAELVRAGLASVDYGPYPEDRYQAELAAAEAEAQASGAGLWAGEAPAEPVTPPPASEAPVVPATPTPSTSTERCHPSYPDHCIPPPPPDLDCGDIPYRRFTVLPPDPHRFDSDRDGIGCES